jgi:hypothetical protein
MGLLGEWWLRDVSMFARYYALTNITSKHGLAVAISKNMFVA